MTIKSTLSVLALVAGVAVSGAAFAQTTIAGNAVSEGDLPFVKAYCEDLQAKDMTSTPAGTKPDDVAADDVGTDQQPSGAEQDTDAANAEVSIDLTTITLEDCTASGILTPAAQ